MQEQIQIRRCQNCGGAVFRLRDLDLCDDCLIAILEKELRKANEELAQHHRQEQAWKHGVWIDPILYEGVVAKLHKANEELARVTAERDKYHAVLLGMWNRFAYKRVRDGLKCSCEDPALEDAEDSLGLSRE